MATACDYCDQGDGGIVCDSGCDSCDSGCNGCSPIFPGKPAGPVFKALDKIAGGVEKLFGLDKCGAKGGTNCDDACDAAMIEDLMIPMDSATTDPYYSQPVMPSVPAENYSQPLEGFSQPMTTPVPQYRDPQYIEPIAPQPAPLPPIQQGVPGTFGNPFSDDEVRFTPPARSQQTSSGRQVQPSRGLSRYLNAAPNPQQRVRPANQYQAHHHQAQQHQAQQHQAQRVQRTSLPQPTRISAAHHQQQVILSKAPAPKDRSAWSEEHRVTRPRHPTTSHVKSLQSVCTVPRHETRARDGGSPTRVGCVLIPHRKA